MRIKLGTVSRIDIFIHWTLLVMFGGLFVFYIYQGASIGAVLAGLTLIATLFGCVILHELGHALTARQLKTSWRSMGPSQD